MRLRSQRDRDNFCLMLKSLITIFIFGFSVSSFAEETEISNRAYIICKNRKEVRTMRVEIQKDNLCHAYYGKMGVEKSVGSGRNHDSCLGFISSIRTNLEKSDWKCRDISSSKITAAAEVK